MRYVLDTHALLWHLSGDKRLGPDAGRILDDADAPLIDPITQSGLVPAIW